MKSTLISSLSIKDVENHVNNITGSFEHSHENKIIHYKFSAYFIDISNLSRKSLLPNNANEWFVHTT